MKDLFSSRNNIEKRLKKNPHILLLSDFDGTLSSIVPNPKDAILKKSTRALLKKLSRDNRFDVGIVSGRKLSDVKRLVNIANIFYAGNHGLEITGPGIRFLHPSCRKHRRYLIGIRDRLRRETRDIKGAIVEDKGVSISLHYRMVRKPQIPRLKSIYNNICNIYLDNGIIYTSKGKRILEVRLNVSWNKANAVKKIQRIIKGQHKKTLTIYLGDDTTDEDVFKSLRKRDEVTVFVGKSSHKSRAQYCVSSTKGVERLLGLLCRI